MIAPYLPPLDVAPSSSWVISDQFETFDLDTARQAAGWGLDVEPIGEYLPRINQVIGKGKS